MFLRRLKYPCTTGLILRRTYPQLYKSHIVKLFEEFPETRRWYNEQRKELLFPNGSRLFFGSAEHESDMTAFDSAEFADIMPDEAQEFSQAEIERLYAVNRCTSNPDIIPKMVFTFMPGRSEEGIPPRGLPYLKRVFVDHKLKGEENRREWVFLQAFSWDNIEWARKELLRDGLSEEEFYSWDSQTRCDYFLTRTEYGANLAALTDKDLREAWLYGKWDVFEGQYFPRFSEARHVRPHAEVLAMLKPWYTYWISGDWGYDHPHTIHLHAKDEHNRVITFGELWGRHVGETQLGENISKICAGRKFKCFPFSWDAFGKLNKTTKKSITEMIGKAMVPGIPKPTPADSSPGSRISRARLTSQLFDADMALISDACPRLIECIPSLVRDPEHTEDVLKVDHSENGIGDDPYDSYSMGLQHELGTIKPAKVKLEEKLRDVRQGFVTVPAEFKPGVDPFAKFGGKKL